MSDVIFNYFKQAVLQGSYNLQGNPPLYVALVNNSYTPDIDTHKYATSALTTYEIAGTNYVAGGVALSSPNVQQDDTGNRGVLYGTNLVWNSATFTARGAILYGSSGSGYASDPMVAYFDFGVDKACSAGTFTLQWNASGIIAIT